MKTVHLLVTGKVQGVGFRWFVRQKARQLRLAGWVKNRSDGSVELAAAGDDASLEMLRSAVRAGPAGARVADLVALESVGDATLPAQFEIRR